MNTKNFFLFPLCDHSKKKLFLLRDIRFALSFFRWCRWWTHARGKLSHFLLAHSGSTLHKNWFFWHFKSLLIFLPLYRSSNEVLEFFTFDQFFFSLLLIYNKNRKDFSSISMISWLITINFIWLHFDFIKSAAFWLSLTHFCRILTRMKLARIFWLFLKLYDFCSFIFHLLYAAFHSLSRLYFHTKLFFFSSNKIKNNLSKKFFYFEMHPRDI